ncbi:MAG: TRAP transporter substrate-binding protein DctP [Gammaproteobacteria bacterium]|jgi:tripartite ATP-independent transporter DctP family solute receptor
MKKLILLLPLLGAALLLAGCGNNGAGKTRHWKFALEEIKGSVQDQYAQKFKQLVEKESDGRIKVTVYPYGSLGTSAQLTELVQNGAVQFAMASPGHLGSVIPQVQLFSLHFLFPEDEQITKQVLSDDKVLSLLDQSYRAKQLKLMGLYQEGWMVWTSNKPIHTPADFKGVKIRTMVSPLLLDEYKAYGANPTPMPYSEVYSGLQLHMVDAQVNPIFAIEEMHFYEVQQYMIFADHLPFITSVITNPGFYDKLSDKDKAMLKKVTAKLHDYIFGVQKDLNARRLGIIKKKSDIQMIDLTADERAAFRKEAMPVRDEYVKVAGDSGKQLLDAVTAKTAELQSGMQDRVPAKN